MCVTCRCGLQWQYDRRYNADRVAGICHEGVWWHSRVDSVTSQLPHAPLVPHWRHPGTAEALSGTIHQHRVDSQEQRGGLLVQETSIPGNPVLRLCDAFQKVCHDATISPCRGIGRSSPVRGQPGFDPWNKVRPVLNAINVTFKRYFLAPQLISIDESMVGMKNRIIQLQYMLNRSLEGCCTRLQCHTAWQHWLFATLFDIRARQQAAHQRATGRFIW